MAHVLLDRAKVVATSMSGNTSNYALTNSPPTGFVDFTGVGDGNTTYYTAADDAGNWEVGIGTFASSGEVLTRTDANVIKSTNSNNRVSWPSSSTPTVFITQPSDKAVYFDASSASSTSILNTGLVVGRDADNDIDFGTDNEIIFRAGAEDQIKLTDGALLPVTDDNVDLGSSSAQFKNGYFDGTIYADAISNLGSITLESATDGIIYNSGAGNSDVSIVRVGYSTTTYGFNLKYMGSRSGSANSLAIFTDNSAGGLASLEAVTVYQDGKVGINDSTPTHLLDVNGTFRVTGAATFDSTLSMGDSDNINIGAGNDLQLYHNGTNSVINNNTGDFYIVQSLADNDMIFQCDDGSGGEATYITLDGGDKTVNVSVPLIVGDNTDATTILGRAKIASPASDIAYFSHYDFMDADSYALAQTSAGLTAINAHTGQPINLNVNDTNVAQVTSTGVSVTGDLTLTSTDAGNADDPSLILYRNSSSPADSDDLGEILFRGRNDNSQDVDYGKIWVDAGDVSDGTEDGKVKIDVMSNGTLTNAIDIKGNGKIMFNNFDFQINNGKSIFFEGATADAYETNLTLADPTADRTITLPDATGTVLTSGNSDLGATTTSSSDVDHVLVNDGGVLKKITVANLGTATTDDATALAIALG